MIFIAYNDEYSVDLEDVDWVCNQEGVINFRLGGYTDKIFSVDEEFKEDFLLNIGKLMVKSNANFKLEF